MSASATIESNKLASKSSSELSFFSFFNAPEAFIAFRSSFFAALEAAFSSFCAALEAAFFSFCAALAAFLDSRSSFFAAACSRCFLFFSFASSFLLTTVSSVSSGIVSSDIFSNDSSNMGSLLSDFCKSECIASKSSSPVSDNKSSTSPESLSSATGSSTDSSFAESKSRISASDILLISSTSGDKVCISSSRIIPASPDSFSISVSYISSVSLRSASSSCASKDRFFNS